MAKLQADVGDVRTRLEAFLAGENEEGEARRIVKIAPGEQAMYWDDCLQESYICVGWDEVGDLRDLPDLAALREALEKTGIYSNKSTISRKAKELWILRELVPGDVVVANRGTKEILAIGKVVQRYTFHPDRMNYRHTVDVEWDKSLGGPIQEERYWAHTTLQKLKPEELLRMYAPPIEDFDGAPGPLEGVLAETGLSYSEEILTTYLLALRSKRFVILTGISGTGKTQLALAVARHLGSGRERRYAIVAVRPDWTDNRGLLGYYNPILQRYVATELLRLLLRAAEEERAAARDGREAKPFFAILDEMNLARVEHYFSDFLSAFESGEPIELHDDDEVESGEKGEPPIPKVIRIPKNLFFTGTVNVDETTYMFSPKVLDRAFVMELNEVDLEALDSTPPGKGDLRMLDLPTPFTGTGPVGAEDWRALGELEGGRLREKLIELHLLLKDRGRHFGYRVAFEVARFVSLAHRHSGGTPQATWRALDLAILMKVLPKLQGTQQELEDLLGALLEFSTGAMDGKESSSLESDRPVLAGEAALLPGTAAKLSRMADALRRRGFASFIE